MNKRFISCLVIFCMIFQNACIHTESSERSSIELLALDKMRDEKIVKGNLLVEHLVYTSAKLPLEDFFDRLFAGEFKTAFQRIDLLYTPATSDDKVIRDLLSVGMVPVYVRINNNDDRAYEFNEGDFTLDDGKRRLQAVPADQLPKTLKKFNFAALGANVYNTGVVVLAVAGVMAILALSAAGGSNLGRGSSSGGGGSKEPRRVYNETSKRTYLDYNNYLLKAQTVNVGEAAQGLLFFDAGKDFDKGNMRFGFKGQSQAVEN